MINPINTIRLILPIDVKSDFVQYPYNDIDPNISAAVKKVEIIELSV
jgi:hypothetical protein